MGMPVTLTSFKRLARGGLNALLDVYYLRMVARALARIGLFRERLWSGYPLQEKIRYAVGNNKFFYEVRHGDYVGMPLYWLGPNGYEPETVRVAFEVLSDAEIFYDVGANTGFFSLLAAQVNQDMKVWAFEPAPQSFEQLCYHVNINRLVGRVFPVNAAISEQAGVTDFYIPDGVFALSASTSSRGMPPSRTKISVATESIDRFCLTHPPPSVIKLDVEGQEHLALRGMRRILRDVRPKIILEVLADGPNKEIETILSAGGYRFGRITPTGIDWRDEIASDPTTTNRNWLCLPIANK